MTVLVDIEGAVVALLEELTSGDAALFADVGGLAAADRKRALAALTRWRRPAAGVLFDGRERAAVGGMMGDTRLTLLVAAGGLRSADAARAGDVDTVGAFELSQRVFAALDGAALGTSGRLVAVDEQIVEANERGVVIEQRWIVDSAATALPTLDGEMFTGADSVVAVQVGEKRASAAPFAFPGVDGAFRHTLGADGRTINLSGQLRAADHAALTAIERALEALVGDSRARVLADGFGRMFSRCVADRYARSGPRRVHPLTGAVVQGFVLEFVEQGG